MYSEKVMDHFRNPRNVGKLENPDAIGEVGNPADGDLVKIYLKIDEHKIISNISFQTFGCAAAIATSSMVTEMAKGLNLSEAEKITREDVANALGGLPPKKMECSNIGAEALHMAINNYRAQKKLS
ncbi:MAG: iron-sulfur cluster assembly scaffold protein [Promethearchaeota archaeon]